MWQWFRLPILTQLDIPAVDHDHLSREDSNTQWILFNSFFKPQLFELWVLDSPRLLTSFHSWSSWSSKSASIGCRRLAASSVSEKPSASVWMDDALFHGYPYGYPYMAIAGKLMNHGMEWDGMGYPNWGCTVLLIFFLVPASTGLIPASFLSSSSVCRCGRVPSLEKRQQKKIA